MNNINKIAKSDERYTILNNSKYCMNDDYNDFKWIYDQSTHLHLPIKLINNKEYGYFIQATNDGLLFGKYYNNNKLLTNDDNYPENIDHKELCKNYDFNYYYIARCKCHKKYCTCFYEKAEV